MNNLANWTWVGAWVVAALTVAVAAQPAQGQSSTTADDEAVRLRFVDYEIRLNAILKTRRDEERQFVSSVLALVREGKLPEQVVETSYKWVLNKRAYSEYPFIYFERVLRIRAQQLELEIPEFDYAIYRERPIRQRSN